MNRGRGCSVTDHTTSVMGENSHLYLIQCPIPTYKLHASSPKTSSVGTMTTLWQRCVILGNTSQTMEDSVLFVSGCSSLSAYGPHHWILDTHYVHGHGRWFTSTKEAVRQWDVPTHVGHGKVNSNCLDNSETITVSMATNVCDVCMTQGNDLLAVWICCTKSTPVAKESVLVCIKTTVRGFGCQFTM